MYAFNIHLGFPCSCVFLLSLLSLSWLLLLDFLSLRIYTSIPWDIPTFLKIDLFLFTLHDFSDNFWFENMCWVFLLYLYVYRCHTILLLYSLLFRLLLGLNLFRLFLLKILYSLTQLYFLKKLFLFHEDLITHYLQFKKLSNHHYYTSSFH